MAGQGAALKAGAKGYLHNHLRVALKDLGILLLALGLAVAIRKFLLGALEARIVWVTFYPAVMVAALYGGLITGFLAAVVSSLIALYGWPLIGNHPFINDGADLLGMVAFLFNGAMIAVVAEVARRARIKAIHAKDQAESANKAKSVFLATMSHELRTPLNAILGFSRLLQNDENISPENKRSLGLINRSGEHLLALINNVLNLSKIEAGHISIDESVLDLSGLMRDLVELLRPRAEAKGLSLSLDLAEDVPRFIMADEAKLRQIVLNLLGNAVKFSAAGTILLAISQKPCDVSERIILQISVRDSGEGIGQEEVQKIFEPFYQAASTRVREGTGLGLAITRDFITLMGGSISVESTLGEGSVFLVDLPVGLPGGVGTDDISASASAAVSRDDNRIPHLAPGQDDWRILIVEDQSENSQLLSRILEQAGFQVRVAWNGAEGVEAFRSWRPHFIWMDWRMPVMDGKEATRLIRSLEGGRDVRIVTLSASVFKQDRDELIQAGADDFVTKPIRFREIFGCMEARLGVRFTYDKALPDNSGVIEQGGQPPLLDHKTLASLPDPLRANLAAAIGSLDSGRIGTALDAVSAVDPVLAADLRRNIGLFQYTAILDALQSMAKADAPEGN
jgi:signal transduction histidine kinase/ActR/RegA family two-component response regulator